MNSSNNILISNGTTISGANSQEAIYEVTFNNKSKVLVKESDLSEAARLNNGIKSLKPTDLKIFVRPWNYNTGTITLPAYTPHSPIFCATNSTGNVALDNADTTDINFNKNVTLTSDNAGKINHPFLL